MTQVWKNDEVIPVTRIEAGPCVVMAVKTQVKDKYEAVQLGYGTRKEKRIRKPQKGQMKDLGNFRYVKEFRIEGQGIEVNRGDVIGVSTFEVGDIVKITGTSKGKGFQGVVKRYGFHGQDETHGNKDQVRMPGSSGATAPAHVFKGTRKPGRMGNERSTVSNLEIIEIDPKENIILVKGAVPGVRGGLLLLSGKGDLKIQEITEEITPEVIEEVKEETQEEIVEETITETPAEESPVVEEKTEEINNEENK